MYRREHSSAATYWDDALENWGRWSNDGNPLLYARMRLDKRSDRAVPNEAWARQVEGHMLQMWELRPQSYEACFARYIVGSDDRSAADRCNCSLEVFRSRIDRAFSWLDENFG